MKASENSGSRAVTTARRTIAEIAAATIRTVRRSGRWPASTIERNNPAAGTVRARAKGGRAKAKAIIRP